MLLNRDGFSAGECLEGGAEDDEEFVNVSAVERKALCVTDKSAGYFKYELVLTVVWTGINVFLL